jgi:hypothetical protein
LEEGLEEEAEISSTRLLRDRILFYASLVLIVVGGLGLALGSWLHDLLRVPIVGEAYTVFGPINVLYAGVGLILLLPGVILLALSLRGGTVSHQEVKQIKAEGEVP